MKLLAGNSNRTLAQATTNKGHLHHAIPKPMDADAPQCQRPKPIALYRP